MDQILAITLRSMQQDMGRLDRVGMNLANAQTVGYQREVASMPFARLAEGAAPIVGVATDPRPGTLRNTGQKLDVALAGPGWFEVQTEHGLAHTRQGNFQLDPQGRLVTAQGHAVQGLGGDIQLPHGMPVIDAQGRIFEGALPGAAPGRNDGAPLAQLKVVVPRNGSPLQRLGEGAVLLEGEPLPLAPADLQVRQGFLENANVNSMQEMVQLIQTMRHFESMQKVALGYDEMVGSAIRRLGDNA
ncbi:MAG: flagellar hook-basal body complex protein [Comamonadaceae bacterium]|nr:MAG: flagellar hook-basal body complex protein [Comamonadaceae bacterium]